MIDACQLDDARIVDAALRRELLYGRAELNKDRHGQIAADSKIRTAQIADRIIYMRAESPPAGMAMKSGGKIL